MTNSPTYDILLTTFTYGGDGMGRLPDGRAVFVPFALPGETVRVRLIEEKRGFARAELLEVLEVSPERIEPRCPNFTRCGGCHYEHMPYEMQLRAKREIISDQFSRLAGIQNPPVEATIPSPLQWNYRNHMQYHLDAEGRLGCQMRSSNRVIPMETCLMADEAINDIFPLLHFDPGSGIDRVSLRASTGREVMLILESESFEPPELTVEELPLSVVHSSPAGALVLAGSGEQVIEVLGRSFVVSAESFFQVNVQMAEKMVKHLLQLPLAPQMTLLELYCGVGLFSAFLAPKVARLVGIESSASACADFEVNLDEYENVELYEAPVDKTLPQLDLKPDMVIADPPRAGMGPKIIERLVRMEPKMLVYISCDPSTLARDAKRLQEAGYTLQRVTPFDLFPQTYHIESISVFTKA